MGSWGTGPFDNDTAGDMAASFTKYIDAVINAKPARASDHYAAARAAVQFILAAHGTDILGGPSLRPALQALRRIRADDEWLEEWSTPQGIRLSLDKEIDRVLTALGHDYEKRLEYEERAARIPIRNKSRSKRRRAFKKGDKRALNDRIRRDGKSALPVLIPLRKLPRRKLTRKAAKATRALAEKRAKKAAKR